MISQPVSAVHFLFCIPLRSRQLRRNSRFQILISPKTPPLDNSYERMGGGTVDRVLLAGLGVAGLDPSRLFVSSL